MGYGRAETIQSFTLPDNLPLKAGMTVYMSNHKVGSDYSPGDKSGYVISSKVKAIGEMTTYEKNTGAVKITKATAGNNYFNIINEAASGIYLYVDTCPANTGINIPAPIKIYDSGHHKIDLLSSNIVLKPGMRITATYVKSGFGTSESQENEYVTVVVKDPNASTGSSHSGSDKKPKLEVSATPKIIEAKISRRWTGNTDGEYYGLIDSFYKFKGTGVPGATIIAANGSSTKVNQSGIWSFNYWPAFKYDNLFSVQQQENGKAISETVAKTVTEEDYVNSN